MPRSRVVGPGETCQIYSWEDELLLLLLLLQQQQHGGNRASRCDAMCLEEDYEERIEGFIIGEQREIERLEKGKNKSMVVVSMPRALLWKRRRKKNLARLPCCHRSWEVLLITVRASIIGRVILWKEFT